MAKKQLWTYFNDPDIFRKVDEFCAWYLNENADKVRITNAVYKRPTAEEVLAFIQMNPDLFERDNRGDNRGEYYLSRSSIFLPTFKFSSSSIDKLQHIDRPDERFVNLKDLVHRWGRVIKTDKDAREALVDELWPLIAQLTEERRIDEGKGFSLQNYGLSEFQHFDQRINGLENRVKGLENHPSIKAFKR